MGNCHLFHHVIATHMLENGADVRFIQALLGHVSLTTTQIYTHVAINKLQEIHAATHPAKLGRTHTRGKVDTETKQMLLTLLSEEKETDHDTAVD